MTFSILARDPATGSFGGAAATGNLCVGAWVLRGDVRAGMSAAQGIAPSPFWGPGAIEALRAGLGAAAAVERVVAADSGRAARQLAVLDRDGATRAYDGDRNMPYCGSIVAENLVVAGNWLAGPEVLELKARRFAAAGGALLERLVAALEAGRDAGGDARGLMSAAVMVLAPDEPPLDLRVDYDEAPIAALKRLIGRVMGADYQAWLATLPTLADPERTR